MLYLFVRIFFLLKYTTNTLDYFCLIVISLFDPHPSPYVKYNHQCVQEELLVYNLNPLHTKGPLLSRPCSQGPPLTQTEQNPDLSSEYSDVGIPFHFYSGVSSRLWSSRFGTSGAICQSKNTVHDNLKGSL